jgi:hypothetical protein
MSSIDETERQLRALAQIEKNASVPQSRIIIASTKQVALREQAGKEVLGLFVASLWTLFAGIGLTTFNAIKSRQKKATTTSKNNNRLK